VTVYAYKTRLSSFMAVTLSIRLDLTEENDEKPQTIVAGNPTDVQNK
jgi:hypothetical protein